MALISCYECKSEISDLASSCPKCGAPQGKSRAQDTQTEKTAKKEEKPKIVLKRDQPDPNQALIMATLITSTCSMLLPYIAKLLFAPLAIILGAVLINKTQIKKFDGGLSRLSKMYGWLGVICGVWGIYRVIDFSDKIQKSIN